MLRFDQVEGLSTICAFRWEREYAEINASRLDQFQRPWYISMCLQRWLNVVLDLLMASVAVGVIVSVVYWELIQDESQAGIALNMIIVASTTLMRLVETWTSLETSLEAVTRLKAAVKSMPTEDRAGEDYIPPGAWPSAGKVVLKDVQVSYK